MRGVDQHFDVGSPDFSPSKITRFEYLRGFLDAVFRKEIADDGITEKGFHMVD